MVFVVFFIVGPKQDEDEKVCEWVGARFTVESTTGISLKTPNGLKFKNKNKTETGIYK
jgi:hypothetical protein